MAHRRLMVLAISLFSSVVSFAIDVRFAVALPTPSEDDLFYRRYRGDDEVDDDRRGRGRGRGGHSENGGSSSSGDNSSSGSGHSSSDSESGSGSKSGSDKGSNPSDENDRFGK
jgi:hypothetical protein